MSPAWALEDWQVSCTACPYRLSGIAFRDLPPCYWTFDVGRLTVWAWNREHLAYIRRYLAGESTDAEAYAWLGTYVPGAWKAQAPRLIEAIAERLALLPLTPQPS